MHTNGLTAVLLKHKSGDGQADRQSNYSHFLKIGTMALQLCMFEEGALHVQQ